MIVASEARRHIANGATFAVMRCPGHPREDIYWLKYASRDGFQIPLRTGRYLEKSGIKATEWKYDP